MQPDSAYPPVHPRVEQTTHQNLAIVLAKIVLLLSQECLAEFH
jgi:hypothetical protein